MIKTPILIVGAGPSGLMLSAQLHRYGARHVIVDQKDGITQLSKALGVQARTLEQYRQLGIADEAIAHGFVAETVSLIINGVVRSVVPLGEIGSGLSPYPYLFILEQSQNEALMFNHIAEQGGDVIWGTEVTDVSESDTGYTGTLKHHDGTMQAFECDYIVGCDGASSHIRHFLNMPFQGGTNEQSFFVADINMEVDFEKHGLLLAVNQNEFLAFFPMSGPQQYRAVGVLPPSIKDIDNFSFEELRHHIERNIGVSATITGHSWHAGYRVHHRVVDRFRSGNAFLVGDAAHIHSPAGGQGMNTGLGDAVNLGWKLAAAVNGWCDETVLNSYDEERRPFGVQLVNTTDKAFSMMVSKSWVPRFMRTYVLPIVLRSILTFKSARRLMFQTISQTRITYRTSSLSDGSCSKVICSGDRFPWFEWEDGNSHAWMTQPGYVVLNLGGMPPSDVPNWSGPCVQITVDGAAAIAAFNAGLPRRGSVVIRPDMHVANIVSG